MANSLSDIRRHSEQRIDLPGVDEAKLKARLLAKPQLGQHPKALKFSGITASQKKKVSYKLFCIFEHFTIIIGDLF